MSRTAGVALSRVTIAAPKRRVDVALPDDAVLAELMPVLLRHAGDGLADDGQRQGGWTLRRTDGAVLDQTRTLAAQEVRDGEILHLVPTRTEWPEMDYDDIVDVIATGARRQSRSWGAAATRRAGLVVSATTLLLALGLLLSTGPGWTVPGAVAVGVALVLVGIAAALSRALSDAGAGAVVGTVAMVWAFGGGTAILLPDGPLRDATSAHYLVGSAALLAVALLGYVAVADRTQYFVAGVTVGLLGIVGALLARIDSMDQYDVAAVLVTIVIAFTPSFPLLSIRLGKMPMPALPTTAEELLADPPKPPPSRVRATVRRSDEMLTGLLTGTAIVAVGSSVTLVLSGRTSALILVGLVGAASLLRGRLFPALRHRLPLMVTGLAGAAALAVGTLAVSDGLRLAVVVPALVVLALLILAASLYYQSRPPSPYLGRIADILDILLVVAVVPVTCFVIGLVSYVRGLYG